MYVAVPYGSVGWKLYLGTSGKYLKSEKIITMQYKSQWKRMVTLHGNSIKTLKIATTEALQSCLVNAT